MSKQIDSHHAVRAPERPSDAAVTMAANAQGMKRAARENPGTDQVTECFASWVVTLAYLPPQDVGFGHAHWQLSLVPNPELDGYARIMQRKVLLRAFGVPRDAVVVSYGVYAWPDLDDGETADC